MQDVAICKKEPCCDCKMRRANSNHHNQAHSVIQIALLLEHSKCGVRGGDKVGEWHPGGCGGGIWKRGGPEVIGHVQAHFVQYAGK